MRIATSLVVWWLRLHAPIAGAQVQSLVEELRSRAKKKKKTPTGVGGSECTQRVELIIIKKENGNGIGRTSQSQDVFSKKIHD